MRLPIEHLYRKRAAIHGLLVLDLAARHGIKDPAGKPLDELRECFLAEALPSHDPELAGWFAANGTTKDHVSRTIEHEVYYALGACLEGVAQPSAEAALSAQHRARDVVSYHLFRGINWTIPGRIEVCDLERLEGCALVAKSITEERKENK